MAGHNFSRRKRSRSLHQRQIRFFTVAGMVLFAVLMTALLWFLDRAGLPGH